MNMSELIALAAKLESAYQAADNLKANTEVLAKQCRAYIRGAIIDYYATKEMILAIANKTKLRATHTIGRTWQGFTYRHVNTGTADGLQLYFTFNGVMKNVQQSGNTAYGQACDGTVYEDCSLTWSCADHPDIEFDLTRYDWIRDNKKLEDALHCFDTSTWSAEGYARMKEHAALLKKRTDIMKRAFENYADEIINQVKEDTANLIVG